MRLSRRSLLAAFGLTLPFRPGSRASGRAIADEAPPSLRFRPFEEAVRSAFAARPATIPGAGIGPDCRRIEVGDSDLVRVGLQGCSNDRPFAGFPEGSLRIIRAGFGPGPATQGTRLYVSTVDVALAASLTDRTPGRPIDFAALPPAPIFA